MRQQPTEEDIRRRAYFHWLNQSHPSWNDPIANWFRAETESYKLRYRHPYIVVDQNCLRDEALILKQKEKSKALRWQILLPDVSMMEMMKGPKWEYSTRRSLEFLASFPELVSIALGLGELMRSERESCEPIVDIVDDLINPLFRELLKEINSGTDGAMFAKIRAGIVDAQNLANRQLLRHTQNKAMLISLRDAWKGELSDDDIRKLRRDPTMQVDLWASVTMTRTCVIGLKNGGFSDKAAQILAAEPSVSGCWVSCLSALALDWYVRGGIDTLLPERATNDLVDLDYIVLGVLSCDLLSKENRVIKMYGDISEVMDARWNWVRNIIRTYVR